MKKVSLSFVICLVLIGAIAWYVLGIDDKVEDASNGITNSFIKAKLDNIDLGSLSEEARRAANEVMKSQEKIDNQRSGLNPFKAISDDTYCMPWNKDRQDDKLNKDLRKKNSIFDKKYKEGKAADAKELFSKAKKFLPLLLISVVIIIVILLLKKFGRRHHIKVEETSRPAPTVNAESNDVKKTGLFNTLDYQRKQLQDLCSGAGIDYGAVTEKFGDDLEGLTRAYTKLSPLVARGDTKKIERLLS